MGILSSLHITAGVIALVLGLLIFRITKGSQRHRVLGYLYVLAMLALNITALMIYRVFGYFGPFHVLAIISLVTLIAGFIPAYTKYPPQKWLARHYDGICWSYVGLLAATAAEIAVRLPFVQGFGWAFGIATFTASFVVVFCGAYVLYFYRDKTIASIGPPKTKFTKPLSAIPPSIEP